MVVAAVTTAPPSVSLSLSLACSTSAADGRCLSGMVSKGASARRMISLLAVRPMDMYSSRVESVSLVKSIQNCDAPWVLAGLWGGRSVLVDAVVVAVLGDARLTALSSLVLFCSVISAAGGMRIDCTVAGVELSEGSRISISIWLLVEVPLLPLLDGGCWVLLGVVVGPLHLAKLSVDTVLGRDGSAFRAAGLQVHGGCWLLGAGVSVVVFGLQVAVERCWSSEVGAGPFVASL